MNKEILPMNEYLLVQLNEDEKKTQIYYGEDKNKPKTATILAFSEKCENKNFQVGKTVHINRYEMIPYNEIEKKYYVSEKAILGMF